MLARSLDGLDDSAGSKRVNDRIDGRTGRSLLGAGMSRAIMSNTFARGLGVPMI